MNVMTDNDGYASATFTGSSDLTIETGLPAISFTPISGTVADLSAEQIELLAQRLIVPGSEICSTTVGNEPSFFFPYANLSSNTLIVPLTLQRLNRIVSPSNSAAAPQLFVPGLTGNGFTLPLSHFLGEEGITGRWEILGTLVEVPPAPLPCADSGSPSECTSVQLDTLFTLTKRVIATLTKESIKSALSGKWKPSGNFKGPFYTRGAKALKDMRAVINEIGTPLAACDIPPDDCSERTIDKARLRMIFNSIFKGTTPVGLRGVEKKTTRTKRAFEAALKALPVSAYLCR
jgi:hypothetical protein